MSGYRNERFAEVVHELLGRRRWSQRRLARAVGVDPAHVSRLLGRAPRAASPELMRRVAAVLGVPPERFAEYREWLVLEAVRNDVTLRERVYRRIPRSEVTSVLSRAASEARP